MAIEMVLAHGDNGQELTPAHEVVEIPALVFAPGNRPIPQTIRALPFRWGRPVRLLGIRRVGVPWPLVRWRDDRGETNCCFVRNLAEADDVLFDALPQTSRDRINAAARTAIAEGNPG